MMTMTRASCPLHRPPQKLGSPQSCSQRLSRVSLIVLASQTVSSTATSRHRMVVIVLLAAVRTPCYSLGGNLTIIFVSVVAGSTVIVDDDLRCMFRT